MPTLRSCRARGRGDARSEDVYARTLDEIACAMNIPLGSAVKLPKGVYGLGECTTELVAFG